MKTLRGIPASPGYAIGPAYYYRPVSVSIEKYRMADPAAEWERFSSALERAKERLAEVHRQAMGRLSAFEAAIFEAHQLFLEDPALIEEIRRRILGDQENAESAFFTSIENYATALAALPDDTFRQRAMDVHMVAELVLRQLLGTAESEMQISAPCIVVAEDLTPADTMRMDQSLVLGFVTALGGSTSHTAILSRSLGIPAVVGVGQAIEEIPTNGELVVDGTQGEIILEADPHTLREYNQRQKAWLTDRERERKAAQTLAQTKDGRRVQVAANLGDIEGAAQAIDWGAEGVGLLRTEFLYMESPLPPSEEEQLVAYQRIAEAMQGRPVVIRTLDIGADKPLPWLRLGKEANPFLGLRGLRQGLRFPHILKTQLRAILRLGPGHNVKIMFPMVATLEEVRAAKKILEEAHRELQKKEVPVLESPEVGIMVEVPSAALSAEALATVVDFFSLGTNDLVQYVFAADRTNQKVFDLYKPLHPAILQLIQMTAQAAHAHGKWVGICGEMGGMPEAIPILVGLGLDELSMNPPAIPQAKALIRNLDSREAQKLAAECLGYASEEEVLARSREFLAPMSRGS